MAAAFTLETLVIGKSMFAKPNSAFKTGAPQLSRLPLLVKQATGITSNQ
jgi:hypothetical protein